MVLGRSLNWLSGGVIVVRVGMADDQWGRVAMILRGPLIDQTRHRARHTRLAGAGVDQEALITTEQQVEEGLLVVHAAAFAQDEKVGVVFVNLPLRSFQAIGAAGSPGFRKCAGANTRAVRLGSLPHQNGQRQYRQELKHRVAILHYLCNEAGEFDREPKAAWHTRASSAFEQRYTKTGRLDKTGAGLFVMGWSGGRNGSGRVMRRPACGQGSRRSGAHRC